MNVNDLICVGAEPIALVDYVAVEQVEPEVMLGALGSGLKGGASRPPGSRYPAARWPRCRRMLSAAIPRRTGST